MVAFKVVIGLKDGKCLQKEVQEPEANAFLGKVIGEEISGNDFGFNGYQFVITGGSDDAGFPMRADVAGVGRKRILAVCGIGLKKTDKGVRVRKTISGNTIHAKTAQINLKVVKEGAEPIVVPVKEKKE